MIGTILKKGDRVVCFRNYGHRVPGIITKECDPRPVVCWVLLSGDREASLMDMEDVELATTQEIVNAWLIDQEG